MSSLEIILTGLLIMFATTIIQAVFMMTATHFFEWRDTRYGRARHPITRATLISTLTLWMFIAIMIEGWIWAEVYLYDPLLSGFADMETAMYFSMVTFTTLGYGDVVLTGEGRGLATIQAANGVIIFGWTTALIFFFIQKIYRKS